jgi:hypothetical protein
MGIKIEPNKTLVLEKSLFDFKKQSNQTALLKSLFAIAALAAGVALLVLTNSIFFSIAIPLILVASFAVYYNYENQMSMNQIFNRIKQKSHDSLNIISNTLINSSRDK